MADPASWDLVDENCSDISDWVYRDVGNGVSEVSPAGQFRFDTNNSSSGDHRARRSRNLGSIPTIITIEIRLYHDALGTLANDDKIDWYISRSSSSYRLIIAHASDGFFVYDGVSYNEVGTNLVKEGESAEWQIWRVIANYTTGLCNIYLNSILVGSDFDFSFTGTNDGDFYITQHGGTTNDRLTHIDYIKVATGEYVPPVYYYFSGYVLENGNPVSRELYLHNRFTGELVDTTTSSGNGYYYLETVSSGSHYIVCLDDEAGEEYNDLIIGNAIPVEIV